MNEGDTAPDFELPNQDGETVSLSALRGKRVVLYFYPKASTPGCTTQACGVRDHLPDYEGAGAVVLGVSPDPVKMIRKFHDDEGLNFDLLGDEDHAVAESYGVWVVEVEVRQDVLGQRAHDIRHRRAGRDPGDPAQRQAGGARRAGARRPGLSQPTVRVPSMPASAW